MSKRPEHWPANFEDFRKTRTRALDTLAADCVLRQVERTFVSVENEKEGLTEPLVVDGELTILRDERRLVMGYFWPGPRDLADIVRRVARASDSFGLDHIGPVRITVEPRPGGRGSGKR